MLFIGTISFLQDDCCDRSIESEVSTLHSQDEMMSEEHNKELDQSARITDMKSSGAKGSLRHTTSDSSSLNGRDCSGGMFRVLVVFAQFQLSNVEPLPYLFRITSLPFIVRLLSMQPKLITIFLSKDSVRVFCSKAVDF